MREMASFAMSSLVRGREEHIRICTDAMIQEHTDQRRGKKGRMDNFTWRRLKILPRKGELRLKK